MAGGGGVDDEEEEDEEEDEEEEEDDDEPALQPEPDEQLWDHGLGGGGEDDGFGDDTEY